MSFFKKAASEPFVSKVDRMMMVFCANSVTPLGSILSYGMIIYEGDQDKKPPPSPSSIQGEGEGEGQ